ncbi:MAG: 2-oxo-4-hydroxy-4-carboxy-5-ureidoimidazoline decarboxylase [Sphingomonadales bacterium]
MTEVVPSAMSREAFVARFSDVFEHSAWIAAETFEHGLTKAHDNAEGLHRALCATMRAASRERKLALINAHPDLAGRLAIEGKLTAASTAEQASAGLDHCTPEEFELFQSLNERYRKRFGFPFIMAVKGRRREEILAALRTRIDNDEAIEFETALGQIERIALLRLYDMLG